MGDFTTQYSHEELATAPKNIIDFQIKLDEEVTDMMTDIKTVLETWQMGDHDAWHEYQTRFNNDLFRMSEILGKGAAQALTKALENYDNQEALGIRMWNY